jgi:hypothetical protein
VIEKNKRHLFAWSHQGQGQGQKLPILITKKTIDMMLSQKVLREMGH